ncbi:MAG TPA: arginine--tRNA ligase [Bacillota bacterium]|nr:arginine--tRNA ligase [Bacillota bacterium]
MASSVIFEVRSQLEQMINEAVKRAGEAGVLPQLQTFSVQLEVPKDRNHGHFATNVALMLARDVKRPPRLVAEAIIEYFPESLIVEKIEVAGPGFINFRLGGEWLSRIAQEVLEKGKLYGNSNSFTGQKIQIEFISANPVGPMNVVNARAGALGDSLGRLLSACGAEVEREYYVNDFGVQVWVLGRSIEARYREILGETVEFPEEGYRGDYISDLAREVLEQVGPDFRSLPDDKRIEYCKEFGYQKILRSQKEDLEAYGIIYDVWFSERSLHQSGAVAAVFDLFRKKNLIYEAEGALWLKTSLFGDDKDRVMRKADGQTTYFVSDIAYHLNKYERGFTHVIDIWGPDHHGYIPRMKAAMQATGINPEQLEILIAQQINLLKGGKPFKMSKRRGEFITMQDLLNELGNDAARWYFLMRSAESHLDVDLEQAKAQTSENPVFYVQYAHARICSIFRQAEEANFTWNGWLTEDLAQWEDDEAEVLELVGRFPEVVAAAASCREPHRITGYLLELGTLFHAYYNRKRFLGETPEVTHARLTLAAIVRIVIAKGLDLLGISAPERM